MEQGEIFDGEFYRHDRSFQQITRTTKKERPWAKDLQFHIFDVAEKDLHWIERENLLANAWQQYGMKADVLQFVPSVFVGSSNLVKEMHDLYTQKGFEGVIIRNAAGLYVFDHRSKDLQKYKEFIDEEFKIVGLGDKQEVITDPVTHKEVTCVVFKCFSPYVPAEADEKFKTFDVRPKGTVADRAKWYQEIDQIVGKELTVRYQELSTETTDKPGGLPIFPVGIVVCDYE